MLVRVLLLCCVLLPCPAVVAGVNATPGLFSPTLYRAIGQANATYDVSTGYIDPDDDDIASISIQQVIGAATAGINGDVITLTPNNVNVATAAASPYSVIFRVCDDGVPSECANAVMTVYYNDPPILNTVTGTLKPGGATTILFTNFFTSTGVLQGDNPLDGDTDAIAATQVASSAAGTFTNNAGLLNGSSCSVTGTDTSDVTFNAGIPSEDTVVPCYVRVCEELPASTLGVCAVTTITITIDVPSQLVLKDGFEEPE